MNADTQVTTETSNLRVREFAPLVTPSELRHDLPLRDHHAEVVRSGRAAIQAVMSGDDDRLVVIVGPCSIHDTEAGLDYARRLRELTDRHREDLVVVMRTYFEKPRTTVGWKGLINDPHLDGSHDIAAGLRIARQFLIDVTEIGLPASMEFLEPISPQHLADLMSWGAIGARTTESQIHRQLTSGLSMPVGFKNGTDGSIQVAIDGCLASGVAQTFLGIDDDGRACLVSTTGNPDTHVVLRGGGSGPNYGAGPVGQACAQIADAGLEPRLMIDASHGNSGKNHLRQAEVAHEIGDQIAAGGKGIGGVMLESFLVGGRQDLDVTTGPGDLTYGQSVTDACLSWDMTVDVLDHLASATAARRSSAAELG